MSGGESGLSPVLVLALDGATFRVIEPLVASGHLPNLARWMRDGSSAPLPSTTPPVTFPAWSSFMTGLEPGEHGIFDFSQKVEGRYRIRFVNARDRRGESIFSAVSRAGGRVLVLGLPATYPPEPLSGLLVPGFDAPVSNATDASSTNNPELYRRIAERAGPWMRPDLDEAAQDEGFHERAAATLLARIERKTEFALIALEEMKADAGGRRPDLFTLVFSESDTVGHHYWRDHDPESPRADPSAGVERRNAIRDVYAALDRACGKLREAYGEDAHCVVISDHGMGGASDCVVHLNRYLAEQGLLVRRTAGAGKLDVVARRARDLALRWLPAGLLQPLFRRARGAAGRLESAARFSGMRWSETLAFSEEVNTQPGVWINVAGREQRGCVPAEDYEAVRDRIIACLLDWKLPNGKPVIARARAREDVYHGPYTHRAPDIVIELGTENGYGLSLVATPWRDDRELEPGESRALRRLSGAELAGGRGRGMNGTHRQNGIFVSIGGEQEAAATAPSRLSEVAPALARAMGLRWRPGHDPEDSGDGAAYSREESEMVEARLRALGYLD
ncbi:MAG: alkaline phosphatase family protein [Myxococcota bacterium]|nr:alkaline phosphatase family protein [Myxococcota bacterium]